LYLLYGGQRKALCVLQMLKLSFLGYKTSFKAWYTYRGLVLDVEKIAVLKNGVVRVVFAGRIAKIGRSVRFGGVLFLLCFLTNWCL
jgi:hypothetical protein